MTTKRITRIARALNGSAWAIMPDKLDAILEFIEFRANGGRLTKTEIAARSAQKPAQRSAGKIAVLQLFGTISQRMDMMSEMSGGTSTERFAEDFDAALKNPDVGAIVIDVDSPGGSVQGVPELAKRIYDARGKKRIVAIANSLMASAAYWIGSAADEVCVTPTGLVGSIGVFMVHTDFSGANEMEGIARTYISAGKYKVEGNPDQPLDEDARAALQENADSFYAMFAGDVARFRGVKYDEVVNGYGEGRVLTAKQALAAGMVDRICTLEDVLVELGAAPGAPKSKMAAEADPLKLAAQIQGTSTATTGGAVAALIIAAAGGAAPVDQAAPRIIEQAPEAGRVPMPEQSTAATAAAPDANALADERARSKEIRALGRENKIDDSQVDAWVDNGASVDQVSREILRSRRNADAAKPKITVGEDRETQKPWNGFGEQLMAVVRAGMGGGIDPRLNFGAAASGLSETKPSDGGFLIAPQYASEILSRAYSYGEVLTRVRKIPIGGNSTSLRINAIDETSRATGSRWGGVQMFWVNEADTATATKPKMRQIELNLQKLLGFFYATDELLEDATALEAVATQAFSEEVSFMVEDAIFNGGGAGQPLGFLNGPSLVVVNKDSGQATLTLSATNILNMWSRCWARSQMNSVWFINQDVLPMLYQITVGGTAAVPVFMPPTGVSGQPYATIMGRPVIPVEYCASFTNQSDVVLADLSQYIVIDKGGAEAAQSMHVRFLNDEMTFRISYRCDGQPAWHKQLTPKNGNNTLSPFVTLQAR